MDNKETPSTRIKKTYKYLQTPRKKQRGSILLFVLCTLLISSIVLGLLVYLYEFHLMETLQLTAVSDLVLIGCYSEYKRLGG